MAITMRLSRGGSKKRPYYRIVVADARSPRDGRFIEKIGAYNPLLSKDSDNRVQLDTERAKHWLSVGAKPTDRVARFLDAAGVRQRVVTNNPIKGKPGEKATERAELRAERMALETVALAEAGIQNDYTVSVALAIDDPEALARLETSARNFMKFFGFAATAELASVE